MLNFGEIMAKTQSQQERGLITIAEYESELAHQYEKEKLRVAELRKEWLLVEISQADSTRERLYDTYDAAYQRIDIYVSNYGESTMRTTVKLLDGVSTVTTLKDDDDDVATFIIQKRNI